MYPFSSYFPFSLFVSTVLDSNNSRNVKSQESFSNDTSLLKTATSKAETPSSEEKKPAPCCCCKETKQARDACIVENGVENCSDLVEAHRVCMRSYGYEV